MGREQQCCWPCAQPACPRAASLAACAGLQRCPPGLAASTGLPARGLAATVLGRCAPAGPHASTWATCLRWSVRVCLAAAAVLQGATAACRRALPRRLRRPQQAGAAFPAPVRLHRISVHRGGQVYQPGPSSQHLRSFLLFDKHVPISWINTDSSSFKLLRARLIPKNFHALQ